ncbi:MAG: YdbL family protein [Bdellovibrionales bacterium]
MKTRFITLVALWGLLIATPALALDLHQARSGGQVGELTSGYVAAIAQTPEVKALVADVNAKRSQEYARISKQNGQSVDVVAKLAAQQIITNLAPGSSYQAQDGSWKKR